MQSYVTYDPIYAEEIDQEVVDPASGSGTGTVTSVEKDSTECIEQFSGGVTSGHCESTVRCINGNAAR